MTETKTPMPESGSATDIWPTEVRLRLGARSLSIAFDTGDSFELPAEYLRIASPSAEVRGHTPEERQTVPGKRNVTIKELQPVGNYAVRIVFDDGHQTGLYTWAYLHELGAQHAEKWGAYLAELAAKGLTR